ncbi:MAG: hypothetical protein M1831_000689 [Alyxoria varia]|nr:MAG: hypothetical protein M1831_000689 [Alyxoria varia]
MVRPHQSKSLTPGTAEGKSSVVRGPSTAPVAEYKVDDRVSMIISQGGVRARASFTIYDHMLGADNKYYYKLKRHDKVYLDSDGKECDPNFAVYRSFDYLHSRLLLHRQNELIRLERELDEMDEIDSSNDPYRLQNAEKDECAALRSQGGKGKGERTRQDVLEDIQITLSQYDELLCKAREIAAFQRPSSADYRSVRNFIANENPLVPKEQEFIECQEDVLTLRRGRECAAFDCLVEAPLRKMNCSLIRYLFTTPSLRRKTRNSATITYLSASRISALVTSLITISIFILLVLPVVAMARLTSSFQGMSPCTSTPSPDSSNTTTSSSQAQAVGPTPSPHNIFCALAVLIVFTLLFGSAMGALTGARRHELFAASAAYCAVLVVFVGGFGGGGGGA